MEDEGEWARWAADEGAPPGRRAAALFSLGWTFCVHKGEVARILEDPSVAEAYVHGRLLDGGELGSWGEFARDCVPDLPRVALFCEALSGDEAALAALGSGDEVSRRYARKAAHFHPRLRPLSRRLLEEDPAALSPADREATAAWLVRARRYREAREFVLASGDEGLTIHRARAEWGAEDPGPAYEAAARVARSLPCDYRPWPILFWTARRPGYRFRSIAVCVRAFPTVFPTMSFFAPYLLGRLR